MRPLFGSHRLAFSYAPGDDGIAIVSPVGAASVLWATRVLRFARFLMLARFSLYAPEGCAGWRPVLLKQ